MHLLLAGLLLATAPLHLLAVLPRFATHVPGDAMDTAEFLLNEWWTAHALLDLRASPFVHDYAFHPLGQQMVHHTYTFLDGLGYALLRPLVPLIVFHNLVVLATVAANGLAAYALLVHLTGMRGLAFVGALAFEHAPPLVSYYKTVCLLEAYGLVLFVLLAHRLVQRPAAGRAALAGLLLGLTAYQYPYYTVFGMLWLGILLGYQLWPVELAAPRGPGPPTAPQASRLPWRWRPVPWATAGPLVLSTVGVLAVAALTAWPHSRAYLLDPATRSTVHGAPADFEGYSVDLVSFVAPFNGLLQPLYERIATSRVTGRPIVATPAFLGYGLLALLLLGLWEFRARPPLRVWIIGWLLFWVLSLGPVLKVRGVASGVVLWPGWLAAQLPLLGSVRTVSRYLVPVFLCTCVVGCLVLQPRLAALGRRARALGLAACLLVVALDYGLVPVPFQGRVTDYRVPEVYRALAAEAGGRTGVLLDLPLRTHSGGESRGPGETRRLYFQTVHQQKMVGGVSSKLDPAVFEYFERQPGVRAFWAARPPEELELAAALVTLRVDWIVVDTRYLTGESLAGHLGLFARAPYLSRFWEDARYLGLRVDRSAASLGERAAAFAARGPSPGS